MKDVKGGVTAALGFKAAGISCGIKSQGEKDIALIYSERHCEVAAVFSTNESPAAPIIVSKRHIQKGNYIQAIVVNSGIANSWTGKQGLIDAEKMADEVGLQLNIPPSSVLVASTGMIGRILPMDKIKQGIKEATISLNSNGSRDACEAIMTTDTIPKEIAVEIYLKENKITIGGIAKGAGMIHPQLATMLAFITTDAKINRSILHRILRRAVDKSFNRISVDGDRSTNDMVVVLANGMSNACEISSRRDYLEFRAGLEDVCIRLAKMIVKDGEGATKFITFHIRGAKTQKEAYRVGEKVVTSPLVKVSFYGAFPPWGRILAAMGTSGVALSPHKIKIHINNTLVVNRGMLTTDCNSERINDFLKGSEILITIDLGRGDKEATLWGCDLSPEYITINAS